MTGRADGERGSILPLILGFFLVALLMIAGSVAAADAYVQQRGLQHECDGAAAAAAATAADLHRGADLAAGPALRFGDVAQAVGEYLRGSGVRVAVALADDATTLHLTCTETAGIAFGAVFGKANGVRHTVHSSARSPLS